MWKSILKWIIGEAVKDIMKEGVDVLEKKAGQSK